MLEYFEHPCNTRCCYCPLSQILAVLLMQSNPVVRFSSPLRESALVPSSLSEISLALFYFVRKLWRGWDRALTFPFCRTLGRAGKWDLYLRRVSTENMTYLLASCHPYSLLVHTALARDKAWSRPNLASHYLNFFTCFTRNLYIITPVWKA